MVPPHTHLGGDVVRGPAEGGGPSVLHHVLLAHPKVSDLDVSLGVQQYVVQLQVPEEDERTTKKQDQDEGSQEAVRGERGV